MKITQLLNWFVQRHVMNPFRRNIVFKLLTKWKYSTAKGATNSNLSQDSSIFRIAFPHSISPQYPSLSALKLNRQDYVATVTLNRPKSLNAFNMEMWEEFKQIFEKLSYDSEVRVAILTGSEKSFSTGMDLGVFLDIDVALGREQCEGRRKEGLKRIIQFFQDSVSSTERCAVPVIAAVSGHCIGGAVDVITACDLRYCTEDAKFSIKETDLAMVADIGTLQRLPGIVGDQAARELTYTGREVNGREAERLGLVLRCFETYTEMMEHVQTIATSIAAKSPITIRGAKQTLLYKREHNTDDSLAQVRDLNSAVMQSSDLATAMQAFATKTKPTYVGH